MHYENEGVPSWSIIPKRFYKGRHVYDWVGMIAAAQEDSYWDYGQGVEIIRAYPGTSLTGIRLYPGVASWTEKNDLGTISLYIRKEVSE